MSEFQFLWVDTLTPKENTDARTSVDVPIKKLKRESASFAPLGPPTTPSVAHTDITSYVELVTPDDVTKGSTSASLLKSENGNKRSKTSRVTDEPASLVVSTKKCADPLHEVYNPGVPRTLNADQFYGGHQICKSCHFRGVSAKTSCSCGLPIRKALVEFCGRRCQVAAAIKTQYPELVPNLRPIPKVGGAPSAGALLETTRPPPTDQYKSGRIREVSQAEQRQFLNSFIKAKLLDPVMEMPGALWFKTLPNLGTATRFYTEIEGDTPTFNAMLKKANARRYDSMSDFFSEAKRMNEVAKLCAKKGIYAPQCASDVQLLYDFIGTTIVEKWTRGCICMMPRKKEKKLRCSMCQCVRHMCCLASRPVYKSRQTCWICPMCFETETTVSFRVESLLQELNKIIE